MMARRLKSADRSPNPQVLRRVLLPVHPVFADYIAVISDLSPLSVEQLMMLSTIMSSSVIAGVLLFSTWSSSSASRERALPVEALVRAVTAKDSVPLYTEEQATTGAAVFGKVCAECHEKKDITGADFRAKWTGRPVWELYELVRTTMPDSNPGSLSRDDYAAALAYILKLNGVPAGPAAVMPDTTAMKTAKLDLPPPAL